MPSLGPGKEFSKKCKSLRLLAVSDVVEPYLYSSELKSRIGEIDLLVSCGDLPPYYLDFLVSVFDVPMVHVLGNHCYVPHDPGTLRCSPAAYSWAHNLDGRVGSYRGLILAGLEGSPMYNMGPHQYTEQRIAWKLLRLSMTLVVEKVQTGRYLDVMVTHAPPRGIHDNTDMAHKGFESLLGFIDRFKPALLLHGHTHRYNPLAPTRTRHGETDIINVFGHSLLTLVRKDEGWRLDEGRAL